MVGRTRLLFAIVTALLPLTALAESAGEPCPFAPVSAALLLNGDRTRPCHTKLAVNQAYLNAISSAPVVAALAESFRKLPQAALPPASSFASPLSGFRCLLTDPNPHDTRPCSERLLECARPRKTAGCSPARCSRPPALPPSTRPEDLAARWRRADEDAIFADDFRSARHFLALSRDYPDHPVGQLAMLAAAYWQQRVGLDDGPGGAEALFAALARECSWLRHPAQLGLLEVALSRGQYAQVRQQAERLRRECSDPSMRSRCELRLAQCEEFEGRFAAAEARYEGLAKTADKGLAAEADYAMKRVGELASGGAWSAVGGGAAPRRDGGARGGGASVRYLGEERATQGDWFLRYGREAFILCAQQSPQDVAGGALGGWAVVPTVGNPQEKTRYWVTSRSDNHRSLLYNPLLHLRRAANWDDRGEAYPIGTGPDLLLEVPVPPGEHVLSLYFVNDRNYYEPGRVYTISVSDEGGRYQTGTEVRHSVRGVYYRFAARGPQRLRLRLWRNLAVNLILAGVFLDRPGAPAPWPAAVPLWAPHRTTVSLPQTALSAEGATTAGAGSRRR